MQLYMKLERKRRDSTFSRISNAIRVFNSTFGFLQMKNNETFITLFETDPYPSFKGELEKIPIALSLEKLRTLVESSKTPDDLGIEISSVIPLGENYVPVLFTLMPYNMREYHDIVFEFVPNAIVGDFADIEKYFKNFKDILVESIDRYNKGLDKKDASEGVLKINKAFISAESFTQHNMEDFKLFYSREQYELVSELFHYLPEKSQERLTLANRDRVAETVIDNFYAFNAINKIATEANIEVRGGSIIVIPKKDKSMKEFIAKTSKLIDEFITKAYHDKEEYNKLLSDTFTNV